MTAGSGSAGWHGSVETGSETIAVGDGVFEGAYSYESRFGEAAGTNPEQLLAAAHAGCFTMALANGLSAVGHPPESLRTKAHPRDHFDREAAHCRLHGRTGPERPMSTDDQQAARSARARAVSFAVARGPQRLRLVLEYLRSHDRRAESATTSADRQESDLGVDQGVRS